MDTMFIKIFENETEADKFAMVHHTKTVIHYDWDEMQCCIIKQFLVKYY